MIITIKGLLRKTLFYRICKKSYNFYKYNLFPINGKNNMIRIKGKTSNVKFDIIGDNNSIEITSNSHIKDCKFHIRGNNHVINIGMNSKIYKTEFWIEDAEGKIIIGENTSIQSAHLAVTEIGRKIQIGNNCMLSTEIEVRTGDSHSVIDLKTNLRVNPASDVIIEDHVWIGSKVSILKGVVIGKDSIIGTSSVVTKSIKSQSLAVGIPARIIKSDINWNRERL